MDAKSKLTQIYLIEKAFYTEIYSYSACLATMGFAIPTSTDRLYYTVGFPQSVAIAASCGPKTGTDVCNTSSYDSSGAATATCTIQGNCDPQENCFLANATMMAGVSPDIAGFETTYASNSSLTTGSFTALASGIIDTTTNADIWTIDQNRSLIVH